MMGRLGLLLLLGLWTTFAHPTPAKAPAPAASPDSKQLERELQSLNWEQFRFVVESVPKLRAEVDAYGRLGWEYVKANYTRYRWKKNIDKLDHVQKRQLAALIQKAKKGRYTRQETAK